MPKKKVVVKKIKPIDASIPSYNQKINFKVQEAIKPDKIKPLEIFDDFKTTEKEKKKPRKKTRTSKGPAKQKNIMNKTPLYT